MLIKKLRRVGSSLVVTIPKTIVDLFGWDVNDMVNIELDDEINKTIKISKLED